VYGLRHRGPGPSPFAPPFEGLPLDLEDGICDVEDHEAVRAAWEEHRRAAGRTGPSISFRALSADAVEPEVAAAWQILEPEHEDDPWSVYGSLWLAAEGRDGETEYEALKVARRRLREADPALLRRLGLRSRGRRHRHRRAHARGSGGGAADPRPQGLTIRSSASMRSGSAIRSIAVIRSALVANR
jgi:hypothetical protein